MASARQRLADLAEYDLTTPEGVQGFTKAVRDIQRDLFLELELSRTMLQAALSTLPPPADAKFGSVSSRKRARAVTACLQRAAKANQYAASQIVKCWGTFRTQYAPELNKSGHVSRRKPQFTFDQKAS